MYVSAYKEDEVFGALWNSFRFQWRGSCEANPEYEHQDMQRTVRRAVQTAMHAREPFMCTLVLPTWQGSAYRHVRYLGHECVRLLLSVPRGGFCFRPPEVEDPDAPANVDGGTGAAKWGVDVFVVGNQAGFDSYLDIGSLQEDLPQAVIGLTGRRHQDLALFPRPLDLPPPPLGRPLPAGAVPAMPPGGAKAPGLGSLEGVSSPHWLRWPKLADVRPWCPPPGQWLTVVEMCAGLGTGLEALLQAGHYIGSYTWADILPAARRCMHSRLAQLRDRFPDQLPAAAVQGWDRRLPFNVTSITPALLHRQFPQGVDVVVAGPPCQPYSTAGKGRGFGDPRSAALLAVARMLCYLDRTQDQGVGYIIENVPGTEQFPQIQETLGQGSVFDAPRCGSRACRKAVFWTNGRPGATLQEAYSRLPGGPEGDLGVFLQSHGFEDWAPQRVAQGYNSRAFRDLYNLPGRLLRVLPKFVTYKGSYAFRFRKGRPQLGLLYHRESGGGWELCEPSADIREVAMGFRLGTTAGAGLSEQERRHLLGNCIDLNLLTWLVSTAFPAAGTPPEQDAPPLSVDQASLHTLGLGGGAVAQGPGGGVGPQVPGLAPPGRRGRPLITSGL